MLAAHRRDSQGYIFRSLAGINRRTQGSCRGRFVPHAQGRLPGRVSETGREKGRAHHSKSFHSLRHHFVSQLANQGVAPDIRQSWPAIPPLRCMASILITNWRRYERRSPSFRHWEATPYREPDSLTAVVCSLTWPPGFEVGGDGCWPSAREMTLYELYEPGGDRRLC